jgi:hypothetical protein
MPSGLTPTPTISERLVAAELIAATFAATRAGFVLAGPEPAVLALAARHAPAVLVGPARGDAEPRTVSLGAPLTAEVVVDAFLSKVAIAAGWGIAAPHVAALDFDTTDGLDRALRVSDALDRVGVPALVVPSENGRSHMWIVLGTGWGEDGTPPSLPAIAWRRALKAALAAVGLVDAPGIELRPASDHPDPASPFSGGNLRLPGSPHRRTGRQFAWRDHQGRPLGATLQELVIATPMADRGAVLALAEMWRDPAMLRPPSGVAASDRSNRYLAAALDGLTEQVSASGVGERNRTTFEAAARAHRLGIPQDVAEDELIAAAVGAGLPEREARAAVRSGYRRGSR